MNHLLFKSLTTSVIITEWHARIVEFQEVVRLCVVFRCAVIHKTLASMPSHATECDVVFGCCCFYVLKPDRLNGNFNGAIHRFFLPHLKHARHVVWCAVQNERVGRQFARMHAMEFQIKRIEHAGFGERFRQNECNGVGEGAAFCDERFCERGLSPEWRVSKHQDGFHFCICIWRPLQIVVFQYVG